MSTNAILNLNDLIGAYSQHRRLLRLTTCVSGLLAECVKGDEGINQGFKFKVSALSQDSRITLKSLIGQPILIELLTAASHDTLRPFHGYITSAEMHGANGGFARYQLTVEPWLAFLGCGRDSRTFQEMTVIDILDSIFRTWQGKGKLVPIWRFELADRTVYPQRSLTTQYQESDLAFAERLMNEEGLFYYFEHTGDPAAPSRGEHTLVIADTNASFKPNSQPLIEFSQASAVMKVDTLDRWRIEMRKRTNLVEIASWDYRTLSCRTAGSAHATSDPAGGDLSAREPLGAYAYEAREQGQRLADNLAQALAMQTEVHIAAGTARTLAPGTTFSVAGHALHDAANDQNERNFIVTRATHLMHNNLSAELKSAVARQLMPSLLAAQIELEEADSLHATGNQPGERPLYRVRIDAIRSRVPYRSNRFDAQGTLRFPKPLVNGQQTAIVVGPEGSVIHTDRDHRIKIQFHWQRGVQGHSRLTRDAADGETGAPGDDGAGTWVRVATPMAPIAGSNWGSHALPRVGQEVLVDFMEGDIDRPVIIGALFNGAGHIDAQNNKIASGAGVSTGNAPSWFPGQAAAHAHPASLSGYKTQAMADSQSGTGAYNQLVFDDSPGQSRIALQRHAVAHQGTDELNLGHLRHQTDNQRLGALGFGAELKTEHSTALRAGMGLLVTSNTRKDESTGQLDSREAQAQIENSMNLQLALAGTAQKHNARLKDQRNKDEVAPDKLGAIKEMEHSASVIGNQGTGKAAAESGGTGTATEYTDSHLQLSTPAGIVAATPASAILSAGNTSSMTAGHAINFAAQQNIFHAVTAGISLFTCGKKESAATPNQELGIRLHAASGKLSSQSQSGQTTITADKVISVTSVTKSINVTSPKHIQLTAQGAILKLEDGNIMLHGPGKIDFKAGMKELAGPQSATSALKLPPVSKLARCPSKLEEAGSGGTSAI